MNQEWKNFISQRLSRAEFPVSQLPAEGQILSGMLPLSRSIKAVEIVFAGGGWRDISGLVCQEMFLAAVYAVMGAALIRGMGRLAVRNTVLEVF